MRIELRNVTKYYGPVMALRDVSLTIESGSSVALIGPNGSGKSTLIHALMGMIRTQGTIRLDGCDPLHDRNILAPRLAYVPQVLPQFNFTVGEMIQAIRLIRDLPHGKIEEYAGRLNLNVAPISAKPVKQLSGGMKQKLSLALALASNAALLVLDEPTASLDCETRQRFYEILNERACNRTLVLSSHRLEEVRQLVTKVVVLNNGQIEYHGPVAEFLTEQNRGREGAASAFPQEQQHDAA